MDPDLTPSEAPAPTDSWSFLERSSVLAHTPPTTPTDRLTTGNDTEALQVSSDGRVARRQRNRQRVVEAYVQLVTEGVAEPTAEALAEVADVTPRSVYRYMSTDSTLKTDVEDRIVSIFRLPFAVDASVSQVLHDRIAMFVAHRLDVHEKAAPIIRTVRNRLAGGSLLIRSALAVPDEQVTESFAPELERLERSDRHALTASVQTLVSFDSLELLCEHLGPNRSVLEATLCRNLRAVVLAACPMSMGGRMVEAGAQARDR